MNLYFDCNNGISGDMSVGALIHLGADTGKLKEVLLSLKLNDEFNYEITKKSVNSIMATDFEVNLLVAHNNGNHHEHRNLEDVNKIIDKANTNDRVKDLAKKIFEIVAKAEAKVHGKDIKDVHFHEVGAIDSIIDILSFSVLLDDLNPEKIYFSALSEGQGEVTCQHGSLCIPVPAVCEIVSEYKIPIKITDNNGEMITPTGAAIVAALYSKEKLPESIIIKKVGYGRGKRPYKNPVLRVIEFSEYN